MQRLFVFGCSFTNYMWPTWADIVAYDLGIPYFNYGLPGLGNVGISHRIIEADIKHTFTNDDIIMIFWTSWCREDRISQGNWAANGSIFSKGNPLYPKFLRNYWDYGNDIVKNSTAIISTHKIYKNNIKWQGSAFPFFYLEADDFPIGENDHKLKRLYKRQLPDIPLVNTILTDETQPYRSFEDAHPDVKFYLNMVDSNIIKLKKTTITRFTEFQITIEKELEKHKFNYIEMKKLINQKLTNEFTDIKEVMHSNFLI